MRFDHENLDCYQLALDIAHWIDRTKFPSGLDHLKDQGLRATHSMVLNIAEGTARGGNAKRNHYRIARGSAAEVCALLDLVDMPQATEQQEKLRRIGAMLGRMSR